MKKLFVARHGETVANRLDIFQGQLNNELTALTEKGLEHAKGLAIFCKNFNIQRIYSSPLKRAYTTAQEIAKDKGIDIIIDERLTECCYGQWEGKKKSELRPAEDWKTRTANKYSFVHPGIFMDEKGNIIEGESYKVLYDRVTNFIDYLKKDNSIDIGLAVTHLGVIRVIAKLFNGLSDEETADFDSKSGEVYEVSLLDRSKGMTVYNAIR